MSTMTELEPKYGKDLITTLGYFFCSSSIIPGISSITCLPAAKKYGKTKISETPSLIQYDIPPGINGSAISKKQALTKSKLEDSLEILLANWWISMLETFFLLPWAIINNAFLF